MTLGWFFKLFNLMFDVSTGWYVRFVGLLLRGSLVVLVVYGGLLVWTWKEFTTAPVGFVPNQDKGYLMVSVQLPDSASVARTPTLVLAGRVARQRKDAGRGRAQRQLHLLAVLPCPGAHLWRAGLHHGNWCVWRRCVVVVA